MKKLSHLVKKRANCANCVKIYFAHFYWSFERFKNELYRIVLTEVMGRGRHKIIVCESCTILRDNSKHQYLQWKIKIGYQVSPGEVDMDRCNCQTI
jgi:hypothetical protein